MDLFHQDDDDQLAIDEEPMTPGPIGAMSNSVSTVTYDQVVRDLIQEERQYLRDLHLIMKVFREQLATLVPPPSPAELDAIFSNIEEIYELTVTLLGSLEDTLEVAEEPQEAQPINSSAPPVGLCFEELAEAAEFDVYDRYAKDVLSSTCRDTLQVCYQFIIIVSFRIKKVIFRLCCRGLKWATRCKQVVTDSAKLYVITCLNYSSHLFTTVLPTLMLFVSSIGSVLLKKIEKVSSKLKAS